MKDTIKNTIHSIEPSETAKDRMYRNILQKASAQTETKTAKPRFRRHAPHESPCRLPPAFASCFSA